MLASTRTTSNKRRAWFLALSFLSPTRAQTAPYAVGALYEADLHRGCGRWNYLRASCYFRRRMWTVEMESATVGAPSMPKQVTFNAFKGMPPEGVRQENKRRSYITSQSSRHLQGTYVSLVILVWIYRRLHDLRLAPVNKATCNPA